MPIRDEIHLAITNDQLARHYSHSFANQCKVYETKRELISNMTNLHWSLWLVCYSLPTDVNNIRRCVSRWKYWILQEYFVQPVECIAAIWKCHLWVTMRTKIHSLSQPLCICILYSSSQQSCKITKSNLHTKKLDLKNFPHSLNCEALSSRKRV